MSEAKVRRPDIQAVTTRCFTSYTGTSLPPTLVGPLDEAALRHRNTFIRAEFDAQDRLVAFAKIVGGEEHLIHRYDYHPNGRLKRAEVTIPGEDEEPMVRCFDESGDPVPSSP